MHIKGQIEANNPTYHIAIVCSNNIIQHIFQRILQFNAVYIPRPNISFQTLTHKTVRTCRYYKFLQHNSQRVYVNYTETK